MVFLDFRVWGQCLPFPVTEFISTRDLCRLNSSSFQDVVLNSANALLFKGFDS